MQDRCLSLVILLLVFAVSAKAQADSSNPKEVTIVSGFKPGIRASNKNNFLPAPLPPDTTRVALSYQLPDHQMTIAYSIRSVQPLAYQQDSVRSYTNHRFVKLGYGNARNPYVKVGLDRGDGVTRGLSFTGRHFSLQQRPGASDERYYRSSEARLDGFLRFKTAPFKLQSTLQVGREGVQQNFKNDYPVMPAGMGKDSSRQSFGLISAAVQLLSTAPLAASISMAPAIRWHRFYDRRGSGENLFSLEAPFQKLINSKWKIQTLVSLRSLRYTAATAASPGAPPALAYQNTMVSVSPSIRYQQSSFSVWAGVTPVWSGDRKGLLPQVAVCFSPAQLRITLMAGVKGEWKQNNYRDLAALNPWLRAPLSMQNTRSTERYLGFKGHAGSHLSYELRTAWIALQDQPLFVNDTTRIPTAAFNVVYEQRLRQWQWDARVSYKRADHFSLTTALQLNRFSGMRSQPKAWGLIPVTLQTSLHVAVLDDLWLQSDLLVFSGPAQLDSYKSGTRSKGAADLNAGLEFTVSPSIRLWGQFNNLFNQTYQRWNRNPVFGFNCSAGVVFSLDQKIKL